jgi:hypothetical protein
VREAILHALESCCEALGEVGVPVCPLGTEQPGGHPVLIARDLQIAEGVLVDIAALDPEAAAAGQRVDTIGQPLQDLGSSAESVGRVRLRELTQRMV